MGGFRLYDLLNSANVRVDKAVLNPVTNEAELKIAVLDPSQAIVDEGITASFSAAEFTLKKRGYWAVERVALY